MTLVSAASVNELFGQAVDMPLDSVKQLLCKKWVFEYGVLGGQKIGAIPGAETMNFEFKKDGTVLVTSTGLKKPLPGTWIYDAAKKLVRVRTDKQNRTTITSLKKTEMVLQIDTKDVTPSDPTPATFVYKVSP